MLELGFIKSLIIDIQLMFTTAIILGVIDNPKNMTVGIVNSMICEFAVYCYEKYLKRPSDPKEEFSIELICSIAVDHIVGDENFLNLNILHLFFEFVILHIMYKLIFVTIDSLVSDEITTEMIAGALLQLRLRKLMLQHEKKLQSKLNDLNEI